MKYFLLVLVILLIHSTVVIAQPGTLDRTFGNAGVVVSQTYSGECRDLLVQNDGKIISVGNGTYGTLFGGCLLVRYDTDGTPDLLFGDSGRVATTLSTRGSNIGYGALQADGKIIAAGGVRGDLAVIRYNPDGALDSSFGINGVVTQSFGVIQKTSGIVIQPDGKIVVSGATYTDVEDRIPTNLYIVRYNSNGSLDQSFGNKGIHQEFDLDPIELGGIALQEDGKLVIGGVYAVSKSLAFFVKRYSKDGFPDTGFGTQGEAQYGFPDDVNGSVVNSISLQRDGKIVCGGSTYESGSNNNPRASLVRFNADGSVDKTFGSNGLVVSEIGDYGSEIHDLALQPDGKIVAAVNSVELSKLGSVAFAVARYLTNGSLDSSFGVNGIQTTVIGDQPYSYAIALQKDGKVVLGGYSVTLPDYIYHVTLARYNGDNTKQPLAIRIKRWLQHRGISWQAAENNVAYYNIEKRNGNGSFTAIGSIVGTTVKDYNYMLSNTATNTSYRVSSVTKDGRLAHSNIVSVRAENNVAISPNPVHNLLHINGLDATAINQLSITDFSGKVWLAVTVNKQSGYMWNVSRLPAGTYVVNINNSISVTAVKMVKE